MYILYQVDNPKSTCNPVYNDKIQILNDKSLQGLHEQSRVRSALVRPPEEEDPPRRRRGREPQGSLTEKRARAAGAAGAAGAAFFEIPGHPI